MNDDCPRRIVILGAGNVAHHLLKAFTAAGAQCVMWSRSAAHARHTAAPYPDVRICDEVEDVPRDADLYIIAVTDKAVGEVAAMFGGTLADVDGIVAHTSGSVPASALSTAARHYGVFYPLQTFSESTDLDMNGIPFFIEGSDVATTDTLMKAAAAIGGAPHVADSRRRSVLHLAAVFACNFANSLWDISSDILGSEGLSLSVLEPLLRETLRKAMKVGPAKAQTGPAVRNDIPVMEKQKASIADDDIRTIYELISRHIQKKSHEQN